jgi:hypothetical protein
LLVEFGQGLTEINMAFFILHGTYEFPSRVTIPGGSQRIKFAAKRFSCSFREPVPGTDAGH